MGRPARVYKYEGGILYLKCSVCGEIKSEDRFYKNRLQPFGLHPRCKECWKKYGIKDKEKFTKYQKEYRERNGKRIYSQHKDHDKQFLLKSGYSIKTFRQKADRLALKYGLKPRECPICGLKAKIEMHHPSYETFDKWSEIVFCCTECHHGIHAGFIECPKPIDLKNLCY